MVGFTHLLSPLYMIPLLLCHKDLSRCEESQVLSQTIMTGNQGNVIIMGDVIYLVLIVLQDNFMEKTAEAQTRKNAL